MGILSLGGTKPKKKHEEAEVIIKPDTTWYRRECYKCPYFSKNDQTEMASCNRNFSEPCLAESLLVKELLFLEDVRLLQQLNEAVNDLPKLPRKKIKRRR